MSARNGRQSKFEKGIHMLDSGKKAPNFTLPDANGDPVTLEQFRNHKIILWFFPKAGTPG